VSGNNSGVVSVMGKEQKTALRQLAHNKRPLSKLPMDKFLILIFRNTSTAKARIE
jgi:hypothetical protein